MIITARKTQLCGTPNTIRKTLNELCADINPREVTAGTQLRVLATELAQRDDVMVSVVTYENQWMEIEVLLSAAPALAPVVIDLGKLGDQCLVSWERWLNIDKDSSPGEPRPRRRPDRCSRTRDRRSQAAVQARRQLRHRRPHRPARQQDTRRTAAPGMPPRPGSRRAAVPHRHGDPAHQQPGRTRPAARQDPAEDQRPAPLSENHPRPVRHPRLRIHRRQARPRPVHRHIQRARRRPLDTTGPRQRPAGDQYRPMPL